MTVRAIAAVVLAIAVIAGCGRVPTTTSAPPMAVAQPPSASLGVVSPTVTESATPEVLVCGYLAVLSATVTDLGTLDSMSSIRAFAPSPYVTDVSGKAKQALEEILNVPDLTNMVAKVDRELSDVLVRVLLAVDNAAGAVHGDRTLDRWLPWRETVVAAVKDVTSVVADKPIAHCWEPPKLDDDAVTQSGEYQDCIEEGESAIQALARVVEDCEASRPENLSSFYGCAAFVTAREYDRLGKDSETVADEELRQCQRYLAG